MEGVRRGRISTILPPPAPSRSTAVRITHLPREVSHVVRGNCPYEIDVIIAVEPCEVRVADQQGAEDFQVPVKSIVDLSS